MYNNVFCFFFSFFLCLCLFVSLSVSFFIFFVASFDGLRPLLVTSHCSLRLLANKLPSFVRTVSVRLSGSGLSDEGRLEVYYHGVWGTVCDRLFDDTDAQVACNALLGFGYVVEFRLLAKYCHSGHCRHLAVIHKNILL